MKHQLDLYGNAIDSLNEGLRRFQEGQSGEIRSFKYAVLHTAHFMELLFKHAVAKEHDLLVLKNPATKSPTTELTIGLDEALRILQNAGHALSSDLIADLKWLKQLRNDIEHYAFDMDTKAVRLAIGRILRATNDFADSANLESLENSVDRDCREILNTLLDEYKEQLSNAQADAADEAGERGDVTSCSSCGELGVVTIDDDQLKCHFCGATELQRECEICFETYRRSEMRVWNDDDPGYTTYVCDGCYDRVTAPD